MLSSKSDKLYVCYLMETETNPLWLTQPLIHCTAKFMLIFITWLCLGLQYCKDCSSWNTKGWVTKYSSKGGMQVDFISLSQDLQTEIKEQFLLRAPHSSTLLKQFQTICHSWSHTAWKAINTLLFSCLSILACPSGCSYRKHGLAVPSNNKVMWGYN